MIESLPADAPEITVIRNRRQRIGGFFLVAVLAVAATSAAVIPFFYMGTSEDGAASGLRMPTTHDMFLHYDQMRSFYAGLASGEIYPRWEEDTNYGFGAPTTSYYPPGVYYVTALGYKLAHDWTGALLAAEWLMTLGSALAVFVYGRRVMSRGASLIAMVAYVLGPYHLIDQYQRGAIAELLGFVWMPLMLLAGEELLENRRAESGTNSRPQEKTGGSPEDAKARRFSPARFGRRAAAVVLLGLSYGAFIWSHPPTAYQFTLAFGAGMLVLAAMRREWLGLFWIGAGMALGVGLAAAYILPAALEQNLIHKEYILGSWPYHNTYVFVHDIFNRDQYVDFYKRIDWLWGLGFGVIVAGGTVLAAIPAIGALRGARPPATGASRETGERQIVQPVGRLSAELRQRIVVWIVIGLLATFLMHKISRPIGQHIPRIEIGIFTWRMLAITSLVVALLAGACWAAGVSAWRSGRRGAGSSLAGFSILVLTGSSAFSLFFVCRPMIDAPVFTPEPAHTNYATLPAAAPGDPEELPDDFPQAQLGEEDNGEVAVEEWKPEHRRVRATLLEAGEIWIRTFNFPGWTANVDGKPAEIKSGEELGDIEIDLPPGTHEVELDFLGTRVRRNAERTSAAAFALSVLVLAGAGAAVFVERRQARREQFGRETARDV